jgi:hypothetical protein
MLSAFCFVLNLEIQPERNALGWGLARGSRTASEIHYYSRKRHLL